MLETGEEKRKEGLFFFKDKRIFLLPLLLQIWLHLSPTGLLYQLLNLHYSISIGLHLLSFHLSLFHLLIQISLALSLTPSLLLHHSILNEIQVAKLP